MAIPTGYFRTEPRRLSYAELGRMARGHGSPLWMWILKTLGISWHSAWARKYPTSIRDWFIPAEELSERTSAALAKNRIAMNALGFESVAFIGQKDSLYPLDSATEIYRHESGRAIASISFVRNATLEKTTISFSSALEDGTILCTTNHQGFNRPPGESVKEIRKASPSVLWQAHEAQLAKARSTLRPIPDREAAIDLQQRNEQAEWDSLIKRRIMVECTPEEVEQAQRRLELVGMNAGGAAANPNAAIMLEMIHLTERKQNWRQALWAFAITLILFIIAGYLRWDVEILWMLIGALIVHELGHYVTMRAFGYQNLRMIFVPLGGAAVIGRNFNAPGWKKAIVSLMGPLPGVLAGAVCALLALRSPNEPRDKAAIMLLVLNGINLLPIFPLDGGGYLNAILFCRNAKLEVVFKALAVVVLAASAFWFHDYLLGALSYIVLIGLRPTFRLARFTEQLRREVSIPQVNDPNELPIDIRNRVIEGVKTALGKPALAKTVAGHALGIFERLNARPPGIVGTITLLAAYGVTFAIAALALVGIFAGKLRHTVAGAPIPNVPWDCAAGPFKVPPDPDAERVSAVTFRKATEREEFVQRIKESFPAIAPNTVAETVFVPHSKEDDFAIIKLTVKMHGRRIVQPAKKTAVCYWSFDAPTPEAAAKIDDAIEAYLSLPEEIHAYAPWAIRPANRPAANDEDQVRQTIHSLKMIETDVDDSTTNILAWRAAVIARIQSAAATNQNGLDMPTVSWYTNYLAATNVTEFIRGPGADGVRRLGFAQRDDPARDVEILRDAYTEADGRHMRVSSMAFHRLEAGFATFGNWLCAQNCSNIRYVIRLE